MILIGIIIYLLLGIVYFIAGLVLLDEIREEFEEFSLNKKVIISILFIVLWGAFLIKTFFRKLIDGY